MEQRRNLRSPGGYCVTIDPCRDPKITDYLRDEGSEGKSPVTMDGRREHAIHTPVRPRGHGLSVQGIAAPEAPGQMARTKPGGEGLAFDAYDEAVNDYLDRVYSERLCQRC